MKPPDYEWFVPYSGSSTGQANRIFGSDII